MRGNVSLMQAEVKLRGRSLWLIEQKLVVEERGWMYEREGRAVL